MCKRHMHTAYDEWLEEEDNGELMVNGNVPFTEKEYW